MEIKFEDIKNGGYDGSFVYICDYRYNDIDNKPIRKIMPQKVLVRSNAETKKRLYYSEYHFIGMNKEDKPLKSKIIPMVDNTGYRWRSGVPVNIFDNMEECVSRFDEQKETILGQLEDWFKKKKSKYEEIKQEVNN